MQIVVDSGAAWTDIDLAVRDHGATVDGGRLVGPDVPVVDAGVRPGAVVRLTGGPARDAADRPASAALALQVVAGLAAGTSHPLAPAAAPPSARRVGSRNHRTRGFV